MTQPQYPRLIARDANTAFYLDRRMNGTGPVELLVRNGKDLRFPISRIEKDEFVNLVKRTLNQREGDSVAADHFVLNFDGHSYELRGSSEAIAISRAAVIEIAAALQRVPETDLAEITRRTKNVTNNTTIQEPQFPYVVARDATASFYLDREKNGKGHLELICRKAGGEESKLTLPYGRNRHIVNFVSGNIDRNHDGSDASGVKMTLDRYAYKLEWTGGEMEVSKESMARICLELQKYG